MAYEIPKSDTCDHVSILVQQDIARLQMHMQYIVTMQLRQPLQDPNRNMDDLLHVYWPCDTAA